MKLILLLGHLVITGPCDCVLAHTSAVGQQLVSDTTLQKFTTMCLMGMCVLEKMSLKRPWSKLQLIKELLICMFQICWNNWGNFSSFQASAITHPGSSQVLQSVRWWRVANVSGKGNSGCCLCSSWSPAMPEGRALLDQSRTRPLAQRLPCLTGLWVIFADLGDAAQPGCSPSLCAGPWEVVRNCQNLRSVFSEILQVLAMWTSNVFKDSGRKDFLNKPVISQFIDCLDQRWC